MLIHPFVMAFVMLHPSFVLISRTKYKTKYAFSFSLSNENTFDKVITQENGKHADRPDASFFSMSKVPNWHLETAHLQLRFINYYCCFHTVT